ncbi:hypothetical protein [Spirosoma utsteinense]|uniref:Uncharacterized protein n=1 Tax=Spirosoma utsteinense TaxID=2585773 RepID=A0ABR6WCK8_9BACT|nr:hypothetical protein [Spirosoma utsteinense]MBC3786916.1 hypothetical protein [Spirosoma utsteinense]MBC3794295.1 hypothetical protein [Spirosoma utsteinense]
MSFLPSSINRFRISVSSVLLFILLFTSLLVLAQVTLKYRMLNGYVLSSDAPVNKGKPTLFVFEQSETFWQVFRPAASGLAAVVSKRPDQANFNREMVIGITIPPTNKPPKLSISKVFVQDSTLTVRYIRMKDTTSVDPKAIMAQPILVVAIPKQIVLRTRLVENGKVIQTLRKHEEGD